MNDIVKLMRAGRMCDDKCRVIEARSGCLCAEAADEIERLREWNAEIALNAREFLAEIERLRAALHGLVGRCMDDFNGGRKLRRGDVDRARAELEEGRT